MKRIYDTLANGGKIKHLYDDTYAYNISGITVGGVATFYLTFEGTAGGTPIFTNIINIIPIASTNTSSAIGVPTTSVKLLSADKKTVTVNVIMGRALLALGATNIFAADGTLVYLDIKGTI